MAINLSKGQSIQLDKKKNNLSSLVMGLGWDVGRPEKTGFFKSLLNANTKGSEFDLDGFAMLLDHDDRLRSDNDLIYFGNLSTSDQTIVHSGDNLTGEGEGDDEQITLQLGRIAERYQRILFCVNIYNGRQRDQHFGMVANAFVRAVDADGKEMARFQLSAEPQYDGKVSMIMGDLVRQGTEWNFRGLGEALDTDSIGEVAQRYAV